jgi:CHAT domain-containing protein
MNKSIFIWVCCICFTTASFAQGAAQDDVPVLDAAMESSLRAEIDKGLNAGFFNGPTRENWYQLINISIQLGDPQLALRVAEKATASFPKEGRFKSRLVDAYASAGMPDKAIELQKTLLSPDLALYKAIAQVRLGILYAGIGDFNAAEKALAQTLTYQDPEHDNPTPHSADELINLAIILGLRGQLAMHRGDFSQARHYFEEEMTVWPRARALSTNQESLKEEGYRKTENLSHALLMAKLSSDEGRYEDARSEIDKANALLLHEKLGGYSWLQVVTVKAAIELKAGNAQLAAMLYANADEAYAKLGVAPENIRRQPIRDGLQKALLQAGRFTDAMAVNSPVITGAALNGPAPITQDLATQGLLQWNLGNRDVALALFERATKEALAKFGRSHVSTLRNQALEQVVRQEVTPESLRESHIRLSRLLAALRNADRSQTVGERPYLIKMTSVYLATLAKLPTPEPASVNLGFQMAEQLRGSSVEGAVLEAASRSAVKRAGLAEMEAQQQSLRAHINAGYDTLSLQLGAPPSLRDEAQIAQQRELLRNLQDERQALQIEMERAHPAYARLTNPELPSLSDLHRYLRPGEALVSIYPNEQGTAVWVVTRDAPPHFHMSSWSQTQIDAAVVKLRATLDVGDKPAQQRPEFDSATAKALYAELLAPVGVELHDQRMLVISAAGSLGQIPFAVLRTSEPQGNGDWLIQRFAISHIPSVNALVAQRVTARAPVPGNSFIGFGDPAFARTPQATTMTLANLRSASSAGLSNFTLEDYARVPALPETRDELQAIARSLGADLQRDLVLGAAATRAAVLSAPLEDKQIIAFATHGLVPGDLPGLSQPALAMASPQKDGESPLLLLEDVMGLRLNADWVVLSACNTASSDGQSSEAISGLGRGFFYAGARALLLTHWSVETISAQQLVTETFKRYGADKSLPRAEALRQAQLMLMRNPKYAHPFFWAPYALVGDGG